MTRTTALREYELAADLLRTRDGALRREILETADGQSSVILVVDSAEQRDNVRLVDGRGKGDRVGGVDRLTAERRENVLPLAAAEGDATLNRKSGPPVSQCGRS